MTTCHGERWAIASRGVGGVDEVGAVLAARFGPWSYHWYWTPGEGEARLDHRAHPDACRHPAFVADTRLAWRRWLKLLAERFDQVRPLSGPARAGVADDFVAWEATIAHVLRYVVALVVDDNAWQGWSRRVLQWLLTAKGVPVAQAQALVHGAIDKRKDDWLTPTTTVIDEMAERLARAVFDLAGLVQAAAADPDGFRLLFRHAAREPEFRDVTDALATTSVEVAHRNLTATVPDGPWVRWAASLLPTFTTEAVIAWLDAGQPGPDQAADRIGNAVHGIIAAIAQD